MFAVSENCPDDLRRVCRGLLRLLLAAVLLVLAPASSTAEATNAVANQKYFVRGGKDLGYPQSLLLASVQALANEKEPTLFVSQTGEDPEWLTVMEKHYGTKFQELSAREALDRFAAKAPQVIYDPHRGRGWTVSIATTLAGVHQAVLTDHDLK